MKRNSNIEILRIISMFMIVISHYCVHSGINTLDLPIGVNRYLLEIGVLGNIGVIIFVLITGYFSINSKEPFKLKKLFILLFEVFVYSTFIYLIFVILGKESFGIKTCIKNLLPFTFKQYWFMTAFILLYIFIPYINKVINSLNRDEHLKLIYICLFIFSILRMFSRVDYYGNDFVQLIYIYIIGSFFGKYKKDELCDRKLNKKVFIVSTLTLLGSVIVFDLIGYKYPSFLFERYSIISILFSVSLFNLFVNKKEFNSELINKISASVLGVYLISDNHLIRSVIWGDVVEFVDTPYMIMHMFILVLVIFVVCIIIDCIRKHTVEKFGLFLYDKVVNR